MADDWQLKSNARKWLIAQGISNPTREQIYIQAYGEARAKQKLNEFERNRRRGYIGVAPNGAELIVSKYWRRVMAENRAKRLARRQAGIDARRKSKSKLTD